MNRGRPGERETRASTRNGYSCSLRETAGDGVSEGARAGASGCSWRRQRKRVGQKHTEGLRRGRHQAKGLGHEAAYFGLGYWLRLPRVEGLWELVLPWS